MNVTDFTATGERKRPREMQFVYKVQGQELYIENGRKGKIEKPGGNSIYTPCWSVSPNSSPLTLPGTPEE